MAAVGCLAGMIGVASVAGVACVVSVVDKKSRMVENNWG